MAWVWSRRYPLKVNAPISKRVLSQRPCGSSFLIEADELTSQLPSTLHHANKGTTHIPQIQASIIHSSYEGSMHSRLAVPRGRYFHVQNSPKRRVDRPRMTVVTVWIQVHWRIETRLSFRTGVGCKHFEKTSPFPTKKAPTSHMSTATMQLSRTTRGASSR